MRISRENYEVWFADWLENKLTPGQMEELRIFLDENHDLAREFDELSGISLEPASNTYSGKNLLKRNLSDIPLDQFELLCAARLEGDLNSGQLSELSEIIATDPSKKRTADLIALTRLEPGHVKYPHTKSLYRRSAAGVIIKLTIPFLSAAAILALLLMTGVLRKGIDPETPMTLNIAEAPSFKAPAAVHDETIVGSSAQPKSNPEKREKKSSPAISGEQPSEAMQDAFSPVEAVQKIRTAEINPALQINSFGGSLATGPSYVQPVYAEADERSRIGKFLARAFREKVLEEPAASDRPLKGYEIAEAGITGINKLLGWEMALTKNTDDNGQTNSVNFNSRLLKFNAPVKNNESGE